METLLLALLLLAAVLLSSVIDQVVPRISSPLIQIGLGLAIALAAPQQIDIDLDPELFLVLFIAPLLFHEAKNVNRAALWKNRRPVISLAIGLVIASALAIGAAVSSLLPVIPLAAAFALGAALGPTDAVAVSSLSKDTDIPPRAKSILEGESLINDASGVVAFQFAVGAAVTGSFSLFDAAADFSFSFFGGVLVGVAAGWLGGVLVRAVRSWGLENTTFHVLFEVLAPFIIFLAAEAVQVSGIIAVVAAALSDFLSPRIAGPSVSRMNIVSSSVWKVLSFALNGIVFVLLGTQLPNAMRSTWEDVSIDNGFLICCIVAITALLVLSRFLWLFAMERARSRKLPRGDGARPWRADARMALVTALAGAKGTITLAIMFTLPVAFPQHELLTFLACGVIVLTLLLATFAVPVLAPRKEEEGQKAREADAETAIDILREVIEELAARQTSGNHAAVRAAIASCNSRIARIKSNRGIDDEAERALHLDALQWERDLVRQLVDSGEASPGAGYRCLLRIDRREKLLRHRAGHWSPRGVVRRLRAVAGRGLRALVSSLPDALTPNRMLAARKLQLEVTRRVIARLQAMLVSPECKVPAEAAGALLLDYQRTAQALSDSSPSVTALVSKSRDAADVQQLALRLELEKIQARYEEGSLSRATAQRLRENIGLMQLDLGDTV